MKLEVGKRYKNRLGEIVTIVSKGVDDLLFPFAGNNGIDYTQGGKYWQHLESSNDLIEECVEPKQSPNYAGRIFTNGEFVAKGAKVRFLDQIGEVIGINDGNVVVSFAEQSMLFGDNMRLLGFENESTLEIVKEEYQVLYTNKFGNLNITTLKVNTLQEARKLVNGYTIVGLIDKNGNIIKE